MRRLLILGSTGSIGTQALQVVEACGGFQVAGLACGRNVDLLRGQVRRFRVSAVAVDDAAAAVALGGPEPAGRGGRLRVFSGPGAAARLVREVEADLVLNSLVGFAGLEATLATLEKGVDLALANKESLVGAGSLVTSTARASGARLLPVDSEHSALFQLLEGRPPESVQSLVITASGGPFRGWPAAELARVTPEQALAHPTWRMGSKITIDSATLMNKGLEIIEAHHLFGFDYGRLEVVVHPQSLVHSLVRLVDGALLAHLGLPDMKVPIAYALHYPERPSLEAEALHLAGAGSLTFEEPDAEAFPSISLARAAGRRGDGATCALNAANEVAVNAFLQGRIGFGRISEVVARVLEGWDPPAPASFAEAAAIDAEARRRAAAETGRVNR